MIVDLDNPVALDPRRAGAKAAILARARQGGLPVLPGLVVEASASSRHMELGAGALAGRGSGGARLAVMAEPLFDADAIVSAGRELAGELVARSSSLIEAGGEWAGAFTSYVGISPEELPKAIVGCWASVFSVDALSRQSAAGVDAVSVGMAVLVQPAIKAVCGGVAEIDPYGNIVVHGVTGSPVSLLHGWENGVSARRPSAGSWAGEEAIALIGEAPLDELASVLQIAAARFGVNRCEWAVTGQVWLVQLGMVPGPPAMDAPTRPSVPAELIPVVRAIMTASGVLGAEAVSPSARVGIRPWEPLVAAVVLDHGTVSQGTPAAAGVGAGLRHPVARAEDPRPPRRAVLTAIEPLANLSQLIWDAAALVTGTGSPAAHIFETARSLGVPAVCGVDISGDEDLIVAVDGYSGLVATLPRLSQSIP